MSEGMSGVEMRTAAKTFANASHGEKGKKAVFKLVVNSVGRHSILRALIKLRLKTCNLDFFCGRVKNLVDACLERAGYPEIVADQEIKILGKTHQIKSRAVANKIVQTLVDWEVKWANIQDIPGNTLRLLLRAQEPLSDIQFRVVILEALERGHMHHHNHHFWALLEAEYTRADALEIIRAGFEAEERCFKTGVYLKYCHCDRCEQQEAST